MAEIEETPGPAASGVVAAPPHDAPAPPADGDGTGSLKDRLRNASVESWITAVVVALASAAVLHRLRPGRVFSDTTPTGGDMGAHVWGPAFLRDELLPNLKLRGWSPDWYAGFPAMQFYMVLPYLAIVLLDVVLPYGTAFKLVAVSGVVSLPISAWAMARLARWPFPVPALTSIAALLFVYDFNFTIYGGNIASTLAGEFAFSISLSLSLVYLGLLMRSLDTGTGRGWAAGVLALVALCHLIPLIFAVGATIVVVAVRGLHRLPELIGTNSAVIAIVAGSVVFAAMWQLTGDPVPRLAVAAVLLGGLLAAELRRSWWALSIGVLGGLLSAFWTLPFLLRRQYLNDMGWEKLDEVRENLFFPDELGGDGARLSILWVLGLALVAVIAGIARWHRPTLTFAGIAAAAAAGFVHWPQHRLWNARILPFWYLSLYVLAGFGVWFLATALVGQVGSGGDPGRGSAPRTWRGLTLDRARLTSWALAPVSLVSAMLFISLYLGVAPAGAYDDTGVFRWGPLSVSSGQRNFVSGWAEWNFSGYEARSGYPTYYDLVTTMERVGEEYGCGRALWEYDRDEIGSYGTPMAPMLLPHWTDGCIGSMEGLYFESSPTVPFHFLMQSELSANPSRPMRNLPYGDLDLDLGVSHLQMAGVRYYVAFSTEALVAASQHSDRLEPVGFADPWTVYLVKDSELVEPLTHEPVVVNDAPVAGRSWTDPAVSWFNDPARWDVPVAADGPDEWARVELITGRVDEGGRPLLDDFTPGPSRELPAVTVSGVEVSSDTVSFDVDQVGVPVLVKISYFPNWSVDGADGPYRVTPNWMVVVPTETHVELRYGATSVEYLAWASTILGLIGVVVVSRRGRVDLDGPRRHPVPAAAPPASEDDVLAPAAPSDAPAVDHVASPEAHVRFASDLDDDDEPEPTGSAETGPSDESFGERIDPPRPPDVEP
jgi:hypothetical protein